MKCWRTIKDGQVTVLGSKFKPVHPAPASVLTEGSRGYFKVVYCGAYSKRIEGLVLEVLETGGVDRYIPYDSLCWHRVP
jgi:hypothetical protein